MRELAAAPANALQHDQGSLTLASGWPPASPQKPTTEDPAKSRERWHSAQPGRSSPTGTTVKCRQNFGQVSPESRSSASESAIPGEDLSRRQGRAGGRLGTLRTARDGRMLCGEAQHQERSHVSIPLSGTLVHRSFRRACPGRRGGSPRWSQSVTSSFARPVSRGVRGGGVAGA